MRFAISIEDTLADADSFYKNYAKDVKELHEKVSWPGKVKRGWCIAAGLQYVLLENHKMLVPPHKLQRDFKIKTTEPMRVAKAMTTNIQDLMGLKPRKDIDYVLCYINFAEEYLTRKPYEVLARTFDEARENYEDEEKKKTYVEKCGDAYYLIAALCLLEAGIDSEMISKTFRVDLHRIQQLGYDI